MTQRVKRPDIHFRISAQDYRHLRDIAKTRDRSVSYVVEKIVKEWIERHAGGEQAFPPKEQ